MCSLKLPVELLEQIVDKYRKHVLWHGGDVNKKRRYLVTWKHACRSKEDGGLGIIDLRNRNSALLMKFLHKFYNKHDLPWVNLTWSKLYSNSKPPHERKFVGSFWWRDIMSLAPNFLLMTRCKVNSGLTISFWNENWDLGVLKVSYPQLFSFAKKMTCSVSQFLSWEYGRSFFLPFSQTALGQFLELK
jgi:hypothetical protein